MFKGTPMLQNIFIISTGGTFNKYYNRKSGELEIDPDSKCLVEIAEKWLCDLPFEAVVSKDSLEMNDKDREDIVKSIRRCSVKKIIVVHGTDTINITAKYIAERITDRQIVLTGAMVPYFIDPVEATANLASAAGYLTALKSNGVFIAMNGIVNRWERVAKDREAGRFVLRQ